MLSAPELIEAIKEAIQLNIPFLPPESIDFSDWAHSVEDVALELGYSRGFPYEFKDHSWTFYLSPEKGLRWGYVRNDNKVGWFESRETTPIPERAIVIKDADSIFGHEADRLIPLET